MRESNVEESDENKTDSEHGNFMQMNLSPHSFLRYDMAHIILYDSYYMGPVRITYGMRYNIGHIYEKCIWGLSFKRSYIIWALGTSQV